MHSWYEHITTKCDCTTFSLRGAGKVIRNRIGAKRAKEASKNNKKKKH